jgi:hypothetical protein
MPSKAQLKQGNLITFFVGSFCHLPDELHMYAEDPDFDLKMDVVLTSPHSGKHPYLHFPKGQYKDTIYKEPPATLLDTLNESTQTKDSKASMSNDLTDRYTPTRHWASLIKTYDEVPLKATVVSTSSEFVRDKNVYPSLSIICEIISIYSVDRRRKMTQRNRSVMLHYCTKTPWTNGNTAMSQVSTGIPSTSIMYPSNPIKRCLPGFHSMKEYAS